MILPVGSEQRTRMEYIKSSSVTIGVRFIIMSVMQEDAGLYSCTASNDFGLDTKYLTLNVVFGSGSGGSGETNEATINATYCTILYQGPKADFPQKLFSFVVSPPFQSCNSTLLLSCVANR